MGLLRFVEGGDAAAMRREGMATSMRWSRSEVEKIVDEASVLNIGYLRYICRQNYVPDIGYRVIYCIMVLNTGRQIGCHIR